MNYNTLKDVLLGFVLLSSSMAAAQEFDSELHLSTDKDVYWYRICSALPGLETYVVTDFSDEDELCPAQLLQTDELNHKSHWKLVAGTDGKVILVNRATDQELDGSSVDMGNYNATLLMPRGISTGFTVTALGDNAFKLESVEDDDVNRCLAVADISEEPITYPEDNLSTSVIGWKFIPIESTITGISEAKNNKITVRVTNKRISVSGGVKWQLFNAQGEEMPRTTRLATGIYMVKMAEKTVKVIIQ